MFNCSSMPLITILSIASIVVSENSVFNHYKVIGNVDDVEIRDYNSLLYVSYVPMNKSDRSNSFRKVADFIFGNNSRNENISMTSPVVLKTYNNYEMAFIMPSIYTIDNLPNVNSSDLNVYEEKGRVKAVISYSGFSNNEKEERFIKKLKEKLDAHNIEYKNDFEVLVYNPPYQMFNRRNEISVTINYK